MGGSSISAVGSCVGNSGTTSVSWLTARPTGVYRRGDLTSASLEGRAGRELASVLPIEVTPDARIVQDLVARTKGDVTILAAVGELIYWVEL